MRRPNSALGAAIVAMGLSAPVASAQQSSTMPDSNPVAPAASSNDPTLASRSARYLLRNGADYLTYRQYAKALRFLRAAESRQAELDAGERKDLRVALDQAQRGLRESGDVANRNRSRPPGAMATSAPAPASTPVQIVEVTRSEPVAAPAVAPVREPSVVRTSATSAGPIELPEPPGALPEPSPTPGQVADLPAPAVAELPTPAPASAPSPAPARTAVELPALPNEVSGPAAAPAPLPESKPVAPELAPTPEPTRPATPTAPPVIGLEPLPEPKPAEPAPAPAPTIPPVAEPSPAVPAAEPAGLPPMDGPAPVPATKPEEATRPEAPAPAPAAVPAVIPVPDASKGPAEEASPLSPAAGSALKRLRQREGAGAPVDDRQTTPAAAPVDDRQPTPPLAPEAVPAPEAAPAALPTPEPRRQEPEPAPAASAEELPALPGQAAEASPRLVPSASPPVLGSRRPLSPELEAEIARVAQRMNDASRTPTAGQPTQLPPLPGAPAPNTPPASTDDLTGLGSGSASSSTRFELTRAPSPTEAWPIRKIPVPEEFVPLAARDWSPNRKYWQAPALCHMPLYFQDAALERYGHPVEQFVGPAGRYLSYPVDSPRESKQRYYILQPLFSSGLFALQIASLPYHLIVDPPGEAEYDLGYYRPGDRIPTDTYYLPLTGVGPPLRGRRY